MFKASFYETEVTPPLGTLIPGHYGHTYGNGVKDRLYIKSVVVDNGADTIASVVLDTCALPHDCHDVIVNRVYEYTGIKQENITIAANHTHAGAPVMSYSDINAYMDVDYKNTVVKLMADAIILAYRKLEPVTIHYSCGKAYDLSFNRNFVMRDGRILTNTGRDYDEPAPLNIPDDIKVYMFDEVHNTPGAKIYNPNCYGNLGGIDPDIPFLMFTNKKGKNIGAIINFACHLTASGYKEFSGDYASIISKELKSTYGNDFVSLFLIGTAGDINHVDFSKNVLEPDVYIKMGKRIADEVKLAMKNAVEITDYTVSAKKEKLILNRRPVTIDLLVEAAEEFIKSKNAARKMMLRNLMVYESRLHDDTVEVYAQCIRIGDVYFYAMPGEIFVDFGLYIKENSPGKKVIITELANGLYGGYIPTREAFHPNSTLYEKSVCEGSCMEVDGGYIISDKLLEMANELSNM